MKGKEKGTLPCEQDVGRTWTCLATSCMRKRSLDAGAASLQRTSGVSVEARHAVFLSAPFSRPSNQNSNFGRPLHRPRKTCRTRTPHGSRSHCTRCCDCVELEHALAGHCALRERRAAHHRLAAQGRIARCCDCMELQHTLMAGHCTSQERRLARDRFPAQGRITRCCDCVETRFGRPLRRGRAAPRPDRQTGHWLCGVGTRFWQATAPSKEDFSRKTVSQLTGRWC